MANLTEIIQQTLNIDAGIAEILVSFLIIAIVAFVGWALYVVLSRYAYGLAKKTKTTLDDEILSAVKIIIIVIIVILGIEYALLPFSFLQPYIDVLTNVFLAIQILLGAVAAIKIISIFVDWYGGKNVIITGQSSRHTLFVIKKIVQIVVLVFAILIILYFSGVDLTGALVGLGVGGIAIAFALQETLSDFFSAFSILLDHPFEIGDFIVVGDHSGTVKSIGVKSTRIQLLQGEELVISNRELTTTSVRNFRKLEKRRATFTIGVTYETPVEKLQKIPDIIKGIFKKLKIAELDRVNFTEFGDFSLKFLIIYYVNSSDWGKYLDTQEQINFAIKEEFEKAGIEMAYPTSTVFVKK